MLILIIKLYLISEHRMRICKTNKYYLFVMIITIYCLFPRQIGKSSWSELLVSGFLTVQAMAID